MSLDLERYMRSRYVNKGREWPDLDCWGLTRLAFHERHGIDLPMLENLDAASLMGKSRNYARLSKILPQCDPQDGSIAAVVTGNVCEHVGLCIAIAGVLYVMETTLESGPRIIPMTEFKREYRNVLCYAPA